MFGREFDNAFGDAFGHEFDYTFGRTFRNTVANIPSFQCRLLYNDDWSWVLWLSLFCGDPLEDYMNKTRAYYEIIPGYSSGYGFEGKETVEELITTERLLSPLQNLTNWLYGKLPFLREISIVRVTLREGTLMAELTHRADGERAAVPVKADDETICAYLRLHKYGLILCFEKYPALGLSSGNFSGISRAHPITNGNLYTPLPEKIEETDLFAFVRPDLDAAETVRRIMASEEVKNITDFIFLRQQENRNTREEIRRDYETLMTDYVNANRGGED